MNCRYCNRREFLKLATAAGGMLFFQNNSFAAKIPLKMSITARCLFAGAVVCAEHQKSLPNPHRGEMNCILSANDDCAGVDRGIEAVRSGKADVGTSCRPLSAAETAAGLTETRLDVLAYSVVVNRKNPVNELTQTQVLKIFAGQIQNWKEVGGDDADIVIYRQECGANYDQLIDHAIAEAGIEKNHSRLKKAVMSVEITDNQFEKIAALDMAVTMAPRSFFNADTKVLKIDGVLPTRISEKNGVYPFLVPISLVTRTDASSAVNDFLSFMKGPQGSKLIENGLNMNWLKEGF